MSDPRSFQCRFAIFVLLLLLPVVGTADPIDLRPDSSALHPDSLHLVDEGETDHKIYVGENIDSLEAYAIRELNHYVQEIAGVEFPVTDDPQGNLILLGSGATNEALREGLSKELKGLSSEGYILRGVNDHLVIAGGGPLGMVYGTYAFLEELGVRWYMPTDLGEVVPEKQTIALTGLDTRQEPSYRIRSVSSGDWALRNKMNVSIPSLGGKELGQESGPHNFYRIVPEPEYYALHPEYFGWNGEKREGWREPPRRGHSRDFCTSNPEVRNVVAHHLIQKARANPHRSLFALKGNDGSRRCNDHRCTRLDEENVGYARKVSRRYTLFRNAVAEQFAEVYPNKLINVFAYTQTMKPPLDDIQIHPNILIELTNQQPYADYNQPMRTAQSLRGRTFRDIVDMWSERATHLGLYEYYKKVNWCMLPFPIVHAIRDDIPWYHSRGGTYFHTQSTSRSTFGNLVRNYYIAAKLTWNTDADVDRILNEFYEKFYGPASGAMRRYYETLDQAMVNNGGVIAHISMSEAVGQAEPVFTESVIAEAWSHLERAKASTEDSTILERIHLAEVNMNYVEMAMDYLSYVRENVSSDDPEQNWRATAGKKAQQIDEYVTETDFPELMDFNAHLDDIRDYLLGQHEHNGIWAPPHSYPNRAERYREQRRQRRNAEPLN